MTRKNEPDRKVTIRVPLISGDNLRDARDLANIKVVLPTPDGDLTLDPSTLTEDDVRAEAFRIARIEDETERARIINNLIVSTSHVAARSQHVGKYLVWLARHLKEMNKAIAKLGNTVSSPVVYTDDGEPPA